MWPRASCFYFPRARFEDDPRRRLLKIRLARRRSRASVNRAKVGLARPAHLNVSVRDSEAGEIDLRAHKTRDSPAMHMGAAVDDA